MMNNTKTATRIGAHALALSAILALSVAVPFFFHLAGLSGHVFLPIFSVLVIGSFYASPSVLTGAALLVPLLNTLITGMPALEPVPMMPLLTVEMVFTALAAGALRKRSTLLRLALPLTLGRVMSLPFVLIASGLSPSWWAGHFTAGIPGMFLNMAAAGALLFFFPPSGKGRERADR
jgi:hypothetical protein